MTHSPSHTALAWREISDGAPKDQQLLVKGGHYQIAAETYPEWYEARSVALVQWREHDGWRGEMCDGDYIWHRPTHFITVAELLAPPGTEPRQSINSELLEAAKEAPGAAEAFDALDVADRLIERAYGTDVPLEWGQAIKRVAHARAGI